MEQEWIKLNDYDAVRIGAYKGKISIQKGGIGKEDIYLGWVNPMKGKGTPATKENGDKIILPFQVLIGKDKEEALKTIQALYAQIKGMEANTEQNVPF
jgi:hypothetical protein